MIFLFAVIVATCTTVLAYTVVFLLGVSFDHAYWMGPFFTVSYLIARPKIYRYLTRC